jgi:hypothetical protein
MNKYLMMSAAALLAGAATGADAKSATLCDDQGNPIAYLSYGDKIYNVAYEGGGIGFGIGGKTKGLGEHVTLSDNYAFGASTAASFDFSLPFKGGGTWNLWLEFSGNTSFEANAGTYTLCTAAMTGRGTVVAATKALIAQLRAAGQPGHR